MRMIKHTGFVPLTSLKFGGTSGFPVEKARELIASGGYAEAEIPEGIEFEEVDDPVIAAEPEAPVQNDIDIPDDWGGMHNLKKIVLAKDIAKANGQDFHVPEGSNKDDFAQQIILAEVDRRNIALGITRVPTPDGGSINLDTSPVPKVPGQPEIINTAGTAAQPLIDPVTQQPFADNTKDGPFTAPEGAVVLPVDGKPEEEAKADPTVVPEIPDNWEQLHHAKRIKLARDIYGDLKVEDGQTMAVAADEAIKAELDRRFKAAEAAKNNEAPAV